MWMCCLLLSHAVLVLGKTGMLDETGEFLKMLESSFERVLSKLAQRELVFVVSNVFETATVSNIVVAEENTYTVLKWFSLKMSSIRR